jgi:hypothetical protein
MAIRSATVSERTEPKLVLRKVPNTTNCRTSMNRAGDNPAPNPLSLAKKVSLVRRAWEVDGGRKPVEQAFQVCGVQVCVEFPRDSALYPLWAGFPQFYPNGETTQASA